MPLVMTSTSTATPNTTKKEPGKPRISLLPRATMPSGMPRIVV
ncbi:hypothetical protein QW131_33800 [Roseibium salinum]|nr:hypothetical protein [Roseibium salinum]